MFDYESAEQDGYHFRAIEVWPAGQKPDLSGHEITGRSDAYRSGLTVEPNQPEEPGR
jgi:cold shock protein